MVFLGWLADGLIDWLLSYIVTSCESVKRYRAFEDNLDPVHGMKGCG
jgi:hypothetical protein